ncbi:MAG: uroporphyrinogen-III synthase [Rhodospirillales bacterium]|jgi:uroporphyrinogen-III synthase|nr:uroporphyrinogen-III synthase [Rhodospirillales bacterium]MDP6644492.1 uroporphyrinogen-III synthase [Rhodospirillales bacterium]MDP6840219.1 uroporphyrinogen-III synthase [Rhodospirillales bacterium]|tara:strand:+ start:2160 stop:4034 length:1875 start_codon:yes stop_codon:yes gene_type:complete
MRVLVTRPGEDGEALANALEKIGVSAVIEPLLTVKIDKGVEPDFEGVQAVMVTSANGVRALARCSARRDIPVFAVGDATAKTARGAEFKQVHSASGDVRALADLAIDLLEPEHGSLVHIAGSEVAGDLGGALTKAGFAYRREVIYEVQPSRTLSASAIAALKGGDIDAVLLFSPRTGETFVHLVRKARLLRVCRQLTIVGLSRAVADTVDEVKWKDVVVAETPTQDALVERVAKLAGAELPGAKLDVRVGAGVDAGGSADPVVPETDVAGMVPVPKPVSGGRPVRTVFLTLLAVIVIAGIATAFRPIWGPHAAKVVPWLVEKESNRNRIEALTSRLARLERDAKAPLPGLEELQAERDRLQKQLNATLGRIEKLETSMEAMRRAVTAFNTAADNESAQTLGDLSKRLAELERLRSEVAAGTQERIDVLQGRIAELGRAGPADAAERKRLARYVFVVGQLRDAVKSARPFNAELDTLKTLFGDVDAVNSAVALLQPHAAKGLETVRGLADRFTDLAGRLVRVEQLPQGEGWVARTIDRLTQSIKWRQVDQFEGNGIEAVVARSERALARGDLKLALAELKPLPPPAAAAAAAWINDAQLLIAVEGKLDALRAHGFQKLEGKRSPK